MRPGSFFISAFEGMISVTMFGTRSRVANHGCRVGRRMEATKNGLPSIRRAAPVMVFNTSFGPTSLLAILARLTVPPTAGSPGKLRSISPIRLNGERSMWTRTATFSSAVSHLISGAFAPAMRRTAARLLHSTKRRRSTWAATWARAA